MKFAKREDIPTKPLPGRALQLLTGQEGAVFHSDVITMGYAHYSIESGPMSPHRHAEEIVVILDSDRAWTRYGGFGDAPDEMGESYPLTQGMILHIPADEWHVFGFEEGGSLDIMFFYSDPGVYSKK